MLFDSNLSVPARLILHAIGTGFWLRVPRDGTSAALVQHFGAIADHSIGPLDGDAVREALRSGLLHLMVEQDVYQRHGWRRLGLDGTAADFFFFRSKGF